MLVSLSNIHKYYNGREILHGVNLTINEGERIGLVGANGCGKSLQWISSMQEGTINLARRKLMKEQ